jgi:hypothetical protein
MEVLILVKPITVTGILRIPARVVAATTCGL